MFYHCAIGEFEENLLSVKKINILLTLHVHVSIEMSFLLRMKGYLKKKDGNWRFCLHATRHLSADSLKNILRMLVLDQVQVPLIKVRREPNICTANFPTRFGVPEQSGSNSAASGINRS